MKYLSIAFSLLVAASSRGLAQELQPVDISAIERVAAAHVAQTLPAGDIGFDRATFSTEGRASERDDARIQALARELKARAVRASDVVVCPGNPSTCQLSVDALVRIGQPFMAPDGAHIVVEVRRRSGIKRQPVGRMTEELILSKENGTWIVLGVARRSAS
jgi:hypothetical protein